ELSTITQTPLADMQEGGSAKKMSRSGRAETRSRTKDEVKRIMMSIDKVRHWGEEWVDPLRHEHEDTQIGPTLEAIQLPPSPRKLLPIIILIMEPQRNPPRGPAKNSTCK
ncbi:B-cell CLL/lymphoma 7 protein family member B, partial [Caligus rogercresseyi]